MSAADTTTTTTGKAPKSRTPSSSGASARHHPYKKNGRGGRGKGRGFVARFHASSAVAASTSSSTNSPPSTSSTTRGPRVWLHDRCDTDEQRQLRQEIVERNPHIAQVGTQSLHHSISSPQSPLCCRADSVACSVPPVLSTAGVLCCG
jgi:hypothetical protein